MVLAETPLDMRTMYPDIGSVANEIFPTTKHERISVDSYEKSLRLQGRLTPVVRDSINKARLWQEEVAAVVYIAGGLTGVDEKTKERYGKVSALLDSYGTVVDDGGREKQLLRGYVPHLHGTDPIKHPQVTSEEVRDIDHLWAVVVPSAHINFFHPMAHGNAIEEGWAESHLIPSTFQNLEGNKLSRLVVGMGNIAETVAYEDFDSDGLERLKLWTDEFAAWLKYFPGIDPREFYYLSPYELRAPLLVKNGVDPEGFNPIFSLDQFLGYVSDKSHPRYGQVGQLEAHDWKEEGVYDVRFEDGNLELFEDGLLEGENSQISLWLK